MLQITKLHSIAVVVHDPFKKAHGCRENDTGDIDFVASILTDLGISQNIGVLSLHHVSKGRAEAGDPIVGRGASALKDPASLDFTVTTMDSREATACASRS